MPDQNLALAHAASFPLEAQDRGSPFRVLAFLPTILSVIVVIVAARQIRGFDFAEIKTLLPTSVLFWGLFFANFLIIPASEWIIYRGLWGVGTPAFGALVRKLVYNDLLVGYLGDAYFYSWSRKKLKFVASPFGAVKDVAVLSAIAGNITTLLFLVAAYPLLALLPLRDHANTIAWSFAFVIGTSVVIMFFRGSIFSLPKGTLRWISLLHVARILISTIVIATLWHLVLPGVSVGWWFLLVTLRLLISRLPFIPNKDLIFASVAVLALGAKTQISALLALMAGLTLITNVYVGLGFVTVDLIAKGWPDAASRI